MIGSGALASLVVALKIGPAGATEPEAAEEPADPYAARRDEEPKPLPGKAHGRDVPPRRGARALLWIPRAVLWLPRQVAELALTPVRFGLYAYERYQIRELFYHIFYTDDRRFGAYPAFKFRSTFGVSIGATVVHRDLFRRGGGFQLTATQGEVDGTRVEVNASSGRLRPLGFGIDFLGNYRFAPRDPFYGIGNGDEGPFVPDGERIDPLHSDRSVETRYSREEFSTGVVFTRPFFGDVSLSLAHVWKFAAYGPPTRSGDEPDITTVYDPAGLVGFDSGLSNAYTEWSLDWDTRRGRPHLPNEFTSQGVWVVAWAGWAAGVAGDPSRYLRYGFDAQFFVDLFGGDRVLRLRAMLDGVTGTLDEVPFTALPDLGGAVFLRGYSRDRFRDRVAALAAAEYVYPVSPSISAYLFVEPGLVAPSPFALDPTAARVSYGVGVQSHTQRAFRARVQVGATTDGEVRFNFALSPQWAGRARF